ncbi:hypothetical protein NQ314_017899, partial [Rhamnusium bicolor]
MGDYEKEQERLQTLMNEVLNDDDEATDAIYDDEDDEFKNDHVEINEESSDTEPEFEMKLPIVSSHLRKVKELLEIWKQFFDADIINLIVIHPNEYLESVAAQYNHATYTRPTDNVEIKALLGLLNLASVKKSNHLITEDHFKTNGTAPEIFHVTMSLQHFRILLRFLGFDDIQTKIARRELDKLAPIRELFDKFVTNCKKNYSVSQQVTVDEKLEASCGRLYVSNQPDWPFSQSNSALSVVEPLYSSNRNVTTDRWFTSIELARNLLSHGLTTIGTIRANKRELPPEFVQKSSRPVGSTMFGFGENCTLVSHIPKKNKNVLLISTSHGDDKIVPQTSKPEIIIDYNHTKCGVDVIDQLCSNYNCARPTRRWQMTVFYSLLNISGINSQTIYTSNNTNRKVMKRHFLENLAFSLIDGHLTRRATSNYLPKSLRLRICEKCEIEPLKEQHEERRNMLG